MGYGVYIFFATMLVLASIYAWFFISETKGLRMDQMDALFGFERPGNDYVKEIEDAGPELGKDIEKGGNSEVEIV